MHKNITCRLLIWPLTSLRLMICRLPALWLTVLTIMISMLTTTLSAGEGGSPTLDPLPQIAPLVPTIANLDSLSPAERLQRELESLVRDRDSRIRSLKDERGDLRPADTTLQHATLSEPFRDRNQARDDLRRALEMYDERSSSRKPDTLEANRPIEQALQRSTLAATNQLRIAECYYDLSLTATPQVKDLSAGLAALELIDITELNDGDPVRLRYLRAWFLIEQTRITTTDAKATLLTEATTAVDRLAADFPTSELTLTARSLLKRLTSPSKASP